MKKCEPASGSMRMKARSALATTLPRSRAHTPPRPASAMRASMIVCVSSEPRPCATLDGGLHVVRRPAHRQRGRRHAGGGGLETSARATDCPRWES
eukprot:7389280-Prymnesium_polylepis.1